MGKCSVCGKKLGMLEGYSDFGTGKEYCKECYFKTSETLKKKKNYNKKEKHQRMMEEKSKKEKSQKVSKNIKAKENDREKKIQWWGGILVALIFLSIFGFFDNDNNEEYTDCIDDCIDDMEYCPNYEYGNDICLSYGGSFIDKYISSYDYDSCIVRLESCVSRCESEYGK